MDQTTQLLIVSGVSVVISCIILYFIIHGAIKSVLEPYMIVQTNLLKLMAEQSGADEADIENAYMVQEPVIKIPQKKDKSPEEVEQMDPASIASVFNYYQNYNNETILLCYAETKKRGLKISETGQANLKEFASGRGFESIDYYLEECQKEQV